MRIQSLFEWLYVGHSRLYPLLTYYAELQDRKSIQIDWMHPAKLVL